MKVLIAGLGKGGTLLAKSLQNESNISIVAGLEIKGETEGTRILRESGVPVFKSIEEVPDYIRPEIVFNTTGDDSFNEVLKKAFPFAEIVPGKTAKLIFDLISEINKNLSLYEGLYKSSLDLLSKEKQNEVLNTIINEALKALDAPAGSIALYDPASRSFSIACSAGLSKNILLIPRWKARKGGLTSAILEAGSSCFVVEDIEKSDLDINPVLRKEGIRFVAAVKLVGNETLLGILYVDDFKPRHFSEFERKTLEMFANIAGLALEKFRLIEQTRQLALTDGLTGLYNHRYLHERLGQEISRARRTGKSMSVLLIDVDNFKRYNDANGHLAGDDALKKIASIIRENIRHGDVASRYGGEEFVVLLYDAKKEDALKVAERIRSIVESEYFLGEENLPTRKLTVSIGIATFPEDSESKDMLLKKADDAMYEAKLRGKNRVVCAGEED